MLSHRYGEAYFLETAGDSVRCFFFVHAYLRGILKGLSDPFYFLKVLKAKF